MGLVLHDSSESIPGPDKCSGDGPGHNHGHDHDGYCSGIIDYTYQNQSQSCRSSRHSHPQVVNNSLQPSSRRSHISHLSKNHSVRNSIETPSQRRSGRSRGSSSIAVPAGSIPFVPPTLMRQDAFRASSLSELHRMGVMNDCSQAMPPQQTHHAQQAQQTHSTRQTRLQEMAYSEPVTMTIYELDDGSTQGSTSSSYASQAQQAYHARYSDGYHVKSKYADWQ